MKLERERKETDAAIRLSQKLMASTTNLKEKRESRMAQVQEAFQQGMQELQEIFEARKE